ncbi:MAG: hypothetical protein JXB44_05810 [Calditrichaceae bacterium]|nr:hypothetical protein [Calditrichaceae bacterium]RQV95862.1 MAG: hypothetical protein EH224_06280 [Calditrichota bacterium]
MNMSQNQNEGFIQPRIIRGQVDSLSLFEITDYELEILEQGTPNSLYLNFAVFFISMAVSFLTSLMTIEISDIRIFIIFTLLTIVGFSIGVILLILWYRGRTKISNVIDKIKARVPSLTSIPPVLNDEQRIENQNQS